MLHNALARREAPRYEVVGEAGTGPAAVACCLAARPDLIVLDVVLPGFNGVEVLAQLRRKLRRLRVVFFSGCLQEQLISRAVALGADAYVLKSQPLQQLLDAIDLVNGGGKYFDPAIAHLNTQSSHLMTWRALTRREQEVARLIAEGKTTKEAAMILGVSAKTVDKHRTSMMNKLGVHDAVSVTRYAIVAGLISLD
jgi:DNA-binding NarL/FixJ family response regulator